MYSCGLIKRLWSGRRVGLGQQLAEGSKWPSNKVDDGEGMSLKWVQKLAQKRQKLRGQIELNGSGGK